MSGIFGIINFDGQPVAHERIEAMRQAMAYWGPHGASTWQEGAAGLGHLLLVSTPEECYETMPRQHPASGVTITAHARLDNRQELMANLGLQSVDFPDIDRASTTSISKPEIPDGDLILEAYLRWGKDCVQHIIGDWAFAAWDAGQRKLFLARDACGISGIYYYRSPRFFAFASCIKALLALPEIPKRPNMLRVAQVLTAWPDDGVQTAYEEIFQLPPAHTLTATAVRMDKQQYWFIENTPSVRLGCDEEYVEAFLEIYEEAVRSRLRTLLPRHFDSLQTGSSPGFTRRGVGATLSSGLDSGSVCALAAQEMRKHGKRLLAFTSVPLYPTERLVSKRYGDEGPLVECDRQFIGNLDVEYIRAEAFGPLAGMRRSLEVHDSPMHAAGNMFWVHALLERAQEKGLGVVLIGQMGNGTISWQGGIENYWPLLLKRQWQRLKHLAEDRSQNAQISLWKIIKYHFVRPVIYPLLIQAKRLRAASNNPWAEYSAINDRWAGSIDLKRCMREAGHDPYFFPPSDPLQYRQQIFRPGANSIGTAWAENSASFALQVRDPTMDQRLAEFCFAIPDEQYHLNGQDRALIRRAMVGRLPEEVRLNTRSGLQAADLALRLQAEAPALQAVMVQLEGSAVARETLDIRKMQSVLQTLQVSNAQINAQTTMQCVTILARGMQTGMFLLRF